MLVLSRKNQESIFCFQLDGEGAKVMETEIKITVLGQEAGKVRIGIQAPQFIGIYREELLDLPPKVADAA